MKDKNKIITSYMLLFYFLSLASPTKIPISIIEIFNQGATYPRKNHLQESYINENEEQGSLTSNGLYQHRILGSLTYNEYKNSIFKTPPTQKSHILYSKEGKTHYQSAFAHSQGLFPSPQSSQKVTGTNKSSLLPPFKGIKSPLLDKEAVKGGIFIPNIKTIPKEQDWIFGSGFDQLCESQNLEVKEAIKNRSHLAKGVEYLLAEYLERRYPSETFFGGDSYGIDEISSFYQEARSYVYYNDDMVPGVDIGVYKQLEWFQGVALFIKKLQNLEFQKLQTDSLVRIVIDNFEGHRRRLDDTLTSQTDSTKKDQKMDPTYIGFSGDDTTLLSILSGYNLTNIECCIQQLQLERYKASDPEGMGCKKPPKFASNLIIELSRESSKTNEVDKEQNKNNKNSKSHPKMIQEEKYFIRVTYNGEFIDQTCKMPDENGYCRFLDFLGDFKDKFTINQEYKREMCHKVVPPLKSYFDWSSIWKTAFWTCCGIITLEVVVSIIVIFTKAAKNAALKKEG